MQCLRKIQCYSHRYRNIDRLLTLYREMVQSFSWVYWKQRWGYSDHLNNWSYYPYRINRYWPTVLTVEVYSIAMYSRTSFSREGSILPSRLSLYLYWTQELIDHWLEGICNVRYCFKNKILIFKIWNEQVWPKNNMFYQR